MRRSSLALLFAGGTAVFGMTQAAAGQPCRPALSFQEVRFSEMLNLQRTWTATLAVDASRCATTSGRFELVSPGKRKMRPTWNSSSGSPGSPDGSRSRSTFGVTRRCSIIPSATWSRAFAVTDGTIYLRWQDFMQMSYSLLHTFAE